MLTANEAREIMQDFGKDEVVKVERKIKSAAKKGSSYVLYDLDKDTTHDGQTQLLRYIESHGYTATLEYEGTKIRISWGL